MDLNENPTDPTRLIHPPPLFAIMCLCLFLSFLYNRRMAFDPANPPIWLRKLHVSAAQINPTDYPASAVEGILAVCRLSSAQHRWVTALRGAIEESDRTRSTVLHS